MMEHFAEVMEELRANTTAGNPTRWILPVGPVAQYSRLIELSNRERISWRNVFTFQMDESLDWQGRPLPLVHPLSFTDRCAANFSIGWMRICALRQKIYTRPIRLCRMAAIRADAARAHRAPAVGFAAR